MHKCALAGLVVLSVLLPARGARAGVTLTRDGKPFAVILIPREAGWVTTRAASELQAYVRRASGATLPIHVEEGFSAGPDFYWLNKGFGIVSIGATRLAQTNGLDTASLPPEGSRIETIDKALFILGRDDPLDTTRLRSTKWLSLNWPLERRGTLFGVCAFLEDYLGVRWLWPGELGTVVPPQPTITLPDIHRTEAPAFAVRKIRPAFLAGSFRKAAFELGESPESILWRVQQTDPWCEHLRMGQSVIIDQTHAYGDPFWEKYHAEHPDWFALQPDGTRMGKPRVPGRVRLCHSNRGLQEEVARVVLDKIRGNPDVHSVGIGLDDVSPETFCQCEPCAALGPTLTDRVVRYASAVAELVARTHADKYVTMFAYSKWADPPQEAELHPNVVLSYVGYGYGGYLNAVNRLKGSRGFDAWAGKVRGKILWRPNFSRSLGIPIVTVRRSAEDLRHFKDRIWGVNVDALSGNWASQGLDQYVFAKLLWDPGQDVDAVIEDYCRAGFGPAREPVREYFRIVEEHTSAIADTSPGYGYREFATVASVHYTDERIAQLDALLQKARDLAAADETVLARIDFLAVGTAWMKASFPSWRLRAQGNGTITDKAALKAALAGKMSFLDAHLSSLAIWAGHTWAKEGWIWRSCFGPDEMDWSQAF